MKKLLLPIASVALILSSCGGGSAEDIKVEDLEDECGCNDAMLTVASEMNELAGDFENEEEMAGDKDAVSEFDKLDEKASEIRKHCEGELELDSDHGIFECDDNSDELKEELEKVEKFF